jgi:hypothetical protein
VANFSQTLEISENYHLAFRMGQDFLVPILKITSMSLFGPEIRLSTKIVYLAISGTGTSMKQR